MKKSLCITLMGIVLVSAGCQVQVQSRQSRDFDGMWTVYSPWNDTDGVPMTFNGSSFDLTGRVNHFYATTIDISGTYSETPGMLHLGINNYTYNGDLRRDDDKDRQRLLKVKTFDFKVVWKDHNIVCLESGKNGPGPEGQVNMVLTRNGERPAIIATEVTWLPSYAFSFDPTEGASTVRADPANQPPQENRNQNWTQPDTGPTTGQYQSPTDSTRWGQDQGAMSPPMGQNPQTPAPTGTPADQNGQGTQGVPPPDNGSGSAPGSAAGAAPGSAPAGSPPAGAPPGGSASGTTTG